MFYYMYRFKNFLSCFLHFFILLFVVSLFMVGSFFFLERYDGLGMAETEITPEFVDEGSMTKISWNPLPYPCFYKVEVFSKTTGLVEGEPTYHFLFGKSSDHTSIEVPHAAIPTYYRVTAHGFFGEITAQAEPTVNASYAEGIKAPIPISHYDASNPASLMPFLIWHTFPRAVCYEVELLSGPPDAEGGAALSKKNHLESTRRIYTNGWQADLHKYQKYGTIYYRVRALNLHLKPISEWSKTEAIVFQANIPIENHPRLNNFDQMPNFEQPLYPVYHWIPVHNVMRYEVELYDHPPEEDAQDGQSEGPVWRKIVASATTCYDEYPRFYAGDYYWRVRAVNAKDHPISEWSEADHFIVKDHVNEEYAALGDSITHGGGAVSFSPASLEYSYTTYLDKFCLNIGRSGDTSHMTLERFDTDVLPLHPKNLFIFTGSNSLRTTMISTVSVIQDLSAIRDKCKAAGIHPIFLTLTPVNPQAIRYAFHAPTDPMWASKLKTINAWIRTQEDYVDLEPYFYDTTGKVLDMKFSTDGLHPDISGKMLMGEIINRRLKEVK